MRHLLSIADLDVQGALTILDTAAELAKVSDGPMKKLPTLKIVDGESIPFGDNLSFRVPLTVPVTW